MLLAQLDRARRAAGARPAASFRSPGTAGAIGGPPDAEVSTAIIRRCASTPVLLPDYPLGQAAQVIARASLVIGMRLHALILAAGGDPDGRAGRRILGGVLEQLAEGLLESPVEAGIFDRRGGLSGKGLERFDFARGDRRPAR